MNTPLTKIAITTIALTATSYAQRPAPVNVRKYEPLVISGTETGAITFPLAGQSANYSAFFADTPLLDGTVGPDWAGTVGLTVTAIQSGTGVDPVGASFNESSQILLGTESISGISTFNIPHTEEFTTAGLTSVYDFSLSFANLTNGYLPSGTVFFVQDIDGGATPGTEIFDLTATSSATGDAFALLYDGSALATGNTSWNISGNSLYAENLGGAGTNERVAWVTTKDITSIDITTSALRNDGSFRFGIAAPVPEPSTSLLACMMGFTLLIRRRN